jgi:Leucine Rich repeat
MFICEVCGVEGDHRYHELLNLRPVVVEIMQRFEQDFQVF